MALDDASLREAANETASSTLAGVIAKAADGAAAAGRRLLGHVLRGDQPDAAGSELRVEQPAWSRVSEPGSELHSRRQGWQTNRHGRVSGRGPQQRLRRQAAARDLLQAQQQARQGQRQQEGEERQQRPPAEDSAQQAEDSGLPVLSGAG